MKKYSLFLLSTLFILQSVSVNAARQFSKFEFGMTTFEGQVIEFEKRSEFDFNLNILEKIISNSGDNIYRGLSALESFLAFIKFKYEKKSQKKLLQKLVTKIDSLEKSIDKNRFNHLRLWLKSRLVIHFATEEEFPHEESETLAQALTKSYRDIESYLITLHKSEKPYFLAIKSLLISQFQAKGIEFFSNYKPQIDLEKSQKMTLENTKANAQDFFVLSQIMIRKLDSNFSEPTLSKVVLFLEKCKVLAPRNYRLFSDIADIYQVLLANMQKKLNQDIFWFEELTYKKSIEINPENSAAYNDLGFLYARFGVQVLAAIHYCKKAVALNPESAIYHDSLGWAYYRAQKFGKAIKELKKAIKLDPNNFEPHFHLGTLYLTLNKNDEAEKELQAASEINPNHADSLNNLAYLYTLLNRDLDKAESLVKKALTLEERNHAFLDTLGWIYYLKKSYEKAEFFTESSHKIKKDVDEVDFHLGQIYLKQFKYYKAKQAFYRVLKTNPRYPLVKEKIILSTLLTNIARSEKEYKKIFGKLEKRRAGKPLSLLFPELRGDILQKFGDFESTQKIFSLISSGLSEIPDPAPEKEEKSPVYGTKIKPEKIKKKITPQEKPGSKQPAPSFPH